MYDSNLYSSPLSLLQLPPAALPEVTGRLTQPGNSVARFSQDGKGLADLRTLVPEADFQQAAEVTVDVGFVCKKCHMVYPAEVLCLNHQRASCFSAKPIGEIKAMLKLVQSHVECRACRERFTTVMDFKFHCDMDRHVKRVQKIQRENNNMSERGATSNAAANNKMAGPISSANLVTAGANATHFSMVPSSTAMLTALSTSGVTCSTQQMPPLAPPPQTNTTVANNTITTLTNNSNNNSVVPQSTIATSTSLVRNGLPEVAQLFFSGVGMDSIRLGMGLDPETPDPKSTTPVGCSVVSAGDSVPIS